MSTSKKAALLASVALTMGAAPGALAQQNEAGEVVENTFTLDYSVGGTEQPGITNDPAIANDPNQDYVQQGDPTDFTVDRKVDLDVLALSTPTSVDPGQPDVPVFFQVTNEGNDNFRYDLAATNRPDGSSDDEFDVTGLTIEAVLLAANGTCDENVTFPSGSTVVQNGPNNQDVPADRVLCVRVTGDVPAGQSDGTDAGLFLAATAVQPSQWARQGQGGARPGGNASAGTDLAAQGNANTIDGAAQNVFLDAAGDVNGDGAGDGRHSDTSVLVVASADLTAAKSVEAVKTALAPSEDCASVPAASQAFAVPGACVEYVITVTNKGSQDATAVKVQDTLPDGVTFAGATSAVFTGGALASTQNPDGTGGACTATSSCTVTLDGATLAAKPSGGSDTVGTVTIRALVD